tara:strand:+ start:862 stop:1266 length:405 start_codon:yes stop_codon:yes gene_type:complete
MKVKITKTIDINDIPIEIRKMLDQVRSTLAYSAYEKMNQVTHQSLSSQGEMFFQAIDSIDLLRQELATVDESLQEVQNILSGYRDALMPPEEDSSYLEEEAEYEKLMSQMSGADDTECSDSEYGKHYGGSDEEG